MIQQKNQLIHQQMHQLILQYKYQQDTQQKIQHQNHMQWLDDESKNNLAKTGQ